VDRRFIKRDMEICGNCAEGPPEVQAEVLVSTCARLLFDPLQSLGGGQNVGFYH